MREPRLPRWLRWVMDGKTERRGQFLARSPLFSGLPRRLLGRLATRFWEKAYEPGDLVFQEGDPGRALFVVVYGSVEITQASARGDGLVRTLGAGDAFGELALIDDSPRSGSAQALGPTRLLILYRTDFEALMEAEARIALVVMRNLSRMLATYARHHPVILVEPAPRPEADSS